MRNRAAIIAFSLFSAAARTAFALCESPTDPDCVVRRETFTGRLSFFATGASLTVNEDGDDRPDRALDVGEVVVPEFRIPPRATLARAYLYFGGSLYADSDGMDLPDTSVELKVPGASDFVIVEGSEVHQSGAIPGFPEVVLYAVRADITELMRAAGGKMDGAYQVRDFDADIFDVAAEHTVANASFSIILVFEEPRLPPRTVVLFDGLQEVLGSTVTLELEGFLVSQVPSGSLTFYAQEGDCNPGPESCDTGNNLSGLERVRVLGTDPGRVLTLTDAVNPPNDIFNRTINTVDPPLRGLPGTDIDAFDITSVLMPDDDRVVVQITTPSPRGSSGELIGLVYVVAGIDVFAPELIVDSHIDIRTERGEVLDEFFPGDPLRVSYVVSNTGNLPATEVGLTADLPANTTRFVVAEQAEGATVTVDQTGGAFNRGRVTVENLSVRHGEANALVLLVETTCPLDQPGIFTATASVGAPKEGGRAFMITSSVALAAREICGPRFFLYGGGGCSDVAPIRPFAAWWLWLAVLAIPLFARRARGWLIALFVSLSACGGGEDDAADRPPPPAIGVDCPGANDMVVVPSIRQQPAFCIDRYEASLEGGVAKSLRFVRPAGNITWQQANDACAAAGKRLCSATEWGSACGGETQLNYPYGDEYDPATCNGFDALRGDLVESGAMILGVPGANGELEAQGCVSAFGAYDLSGNVWEWNSTSYLEGSRRGLVGGSFRANTNGLRCVVEDNYARPEEMNDAFGFRCCKDAP